VRSVYVISPVLNEAPNIPELLQSWRKLSEDLSEYQFHFILVDDGSTDGTGDIALKLRGDLELTVLRHDKNKGPGYAFGTGFEYLAGRLEPEHIVVTIEGDNTSRTGTLKIMLGRIKNENCDVAFASPHAYGGGFTSTSMLKVIASHAASGLTKIALNVRGIHTFTSFFRAYQGHVIISLQNSYGKRILEFNGFECMIELLKKIVNHHFTISEVPMTLDSSLRKGKSKLKIVKTSFRYFAVFVKARKWNSQINNCENACEQVDR
jgi:dolichol-phosphate mannosyltransferase